MAFKKMTTGLFSSGHLMLLSGQVGNLGTASPISGMASRSLQRSTGPRSYSSLSSEEAA